MKRSAILKKIIAIACFASLGLAPELAMAIGPHKNVIVPFLAAGEREIELNIGTRTHDNASRESSATIGYGYAFTNFFKSEIELQLNQSEELQNLDHASARVDAIEWENHLLFTDRGEYFIDPGIFWEIERPFDRAEGYELVIGGLFRKDIKMLELNFNPYLVKSWARKEPEPMQLGYQWQGKYRFLQTANQSTLSIGAQGFGSLGKWNNWEPPQDQEHRIGPALFYKLRTGYNRNAWNGSVAYLFDLTKRNWTDSSDESIGSGSLRSRAATFRAQIEWEF